MAQNVAQPVVQDIDGDSDTDIVVGFRVEDSGIECDDTEVTLAGSTLAGVTFTGNDEITTINCETSGCHP